MGWWSGNGSLERSNKGDFEIEVTDQSVKVRLNASAKSPRGRFHWAAFFIVLWIAALCFVVFASGKQGASSMWHDFATHPVSSSGFIVPLVILLGMSALMVLISWRYVVMAYPSDETFYCDRSTLTISKVRWLDIANKDWRSRSYPLREVKQIKYQVVARARGGAIYGLRFKAAGRSERVLPGIGTRDAGNVLKAVRAFGASATE